MCRLLRCAGDDDSDNEDLAGDVRAAAVQAAYERDRAARKARKAALAPVELAYEIDNTDAEQVTASGRRRIMAPSVVPGARQRLVGLQCRPARWVAGRRSAHCVTS